ncbi:MAG TPA: hypothetical protein VFQ68_33255 [Streptosporangiaceae bacterium]|nr:hypothetical protein [Streptosporangiaceae bacterium]HEU5392003.1 hypothetical protein [Streptosporangiaceae bacterium]
MHRTAKGMPGTAISPAVPTRNRSQTIMTRRRGNRSARPDSSGPPAIGGSYVSAVRNTEWVRP